jgi:hypothetical protein
VELLLAFENARGLVGPVGAIHRPRGHRKTTLEKWYQYGGEKKKHGNIMQERFLSVSANRKISELNTRKEERSSRIAEKVIQALSEERYPSAKRTRDSQAYRHLSVKEGKRRK